MLDLYSVVLAVHAKITACPIPILMY